MYTTKYFITLAVLVLGLTLGNDVVKAEEVDPFHSNKCHDITCVIETTNSTCRISMAKQLGDRSMKVPPTFGFGNQVTYKTTHYLLPSVRGTPHEMIHINQGMCGRPDHNPYKIDCQQNDEVPCLI